MFYLFGWYREKENLNYEIYRMIILVTFISQLKRNSLLLPSSKASTKLII